MKADSKKVSVIMPSLNVAAYISECLESVVNQTLHEIEIICVDADSDDGTRDIIEKYAKKDARIKLIVSDKKSYGHQVNLGFDKAQGEYVAIVETDDYIRLDMYEKLYAVAKENNADFVKADYATFKGGRHSREFIHKKIVESDFYYNRILWAGDEPIVFNGSIYPWAGIYKRSLITKNTIRLNESAGASYQDNGLAFQVYAYGTRGFFVDEEFYYLRRENQDASFYSPHKVWEIFSEFDFIYDFLIRSGFYQIFARRFWKLKYQTLCWRANMIADEHKLEYMRRFSNEFKAAVQNGTLNTTFFTKDEKKYLSQIIACPDMICWKKYYTKDSVWQKPKAAPQKQVSDERISVNKKKILVVTNELSYSGAQLSAYAQSGKLRESGAEVEVWSLKDGELKSRYEQDEIKVRIVYPHEFEWTHIQDAIRQFDLAIVNTILSIVAAAACQKLIPTILYVRSDGELIVHFFKRAITFQDNFERYYAFKNAEYVVAVSNFCGDWVRQNINPNVFVINNFLEDRFGDFKEKTKSVQEGGHIKFLALGSIEPRKGFDVYLEAFRLLPKKYKNKCEVHFAGRFLKGCEKFYNNIINLAEKTQGCFFHGEILDRDELYKLVLDCDIIVVPSRSESFSRVAIEGMMLSKPVIVTEDVGAKYLVNDENGWIVQTGNATSLASAFKTAIDNAQNLNKMGEKAREVYLKNCTGEAYKNKFIPYCERVMADWKKSNHNKKDVFDLYSFDVFDTLITRTTATPTGIFSLVQQKLALQKEWADISPHVKDNFYDLRVNAERLARFMRQGTDFEKLNPYYMPREDITFEEIYNVFVFSALLTQEQSRRVMELEIQTEIENTFPIERNINRVKELLSSGARVVAISDMYHSANVIKRFLAAADSVLKDIPIYASSETLVSKGSGNMFRKVSKLENVRFEKWHHTGDNKRGDFEIPKQFGIECSLYQGSWRNGIENHILGSFFREVPSQKFVAFSKNTRIENNFFGKSALGASLCTFILLPYIEFILQQCKEKNISRLYFVARDGYILKQIADVFIQKRGLNVATKYVYGSRNAWRVFSDDPLQNDIASLLAHSNYNFINSIEKLAETFSITQEELNGFLPNNFKTCKIIRQKELFEIVQNLDESIEFKKFVSEKHSQKRDLLIRYLKQEVNFSTPDYAFVDLDGSGVTNDFFSKILFEIQKHDAPVKTIFFWVTNTNLVHRSHEFVSFFPSKLAKGNIIECLCRAPHSQVIGYEESNGKIVPKFVQNNEGQILMQEGYGEYIQGVLAAAAHYCENPVEIPLNVVERAFDYIVSKPDPEMLSFLGDVVFEATGRSDEIKRFAPALTKDDIFNLYFKRHIKKEPIEKYFAVSYFDYCLLRCTPQERGLMDYYSRLATTYERERKLSKLTEEDFVQIRRNAESMEFKNVARGGNANDELRSIYASYSWRIGHKLVVCANKLRRNFIVEKILKIGFVKTLAKKCLRFF